MKKNVAFANACVSDLCCWNHWIQFHWNFDIIVPRCSMTDITILQNSFLLCLRMSLNIHCPLKYKWCTFSAFIFQTSWQSVYTSLDDAFLHIYWGLYTTIFNFVFPCLEWITSIQFHFVTCESWRIVQRSSMLYCKNCFG